MYHGTASHTRQHLPEISQGMGTCSAWRRMKYRCGHTSSHTLLGILPDIFLFPLPDTRIRGAHLSGEAPANRFRHPFKQGFAKTIISDHWLLNESNTP